MFAANRIVVCTPLTNTTRSGLVLAQGEEKRKPELGEVVLIGEGKKPVEFKIGDTVVYRRYTDNEVMVKGKTYNFIDFKDILCVIPLMVATPNGEETLNDQNT